jgi:FkbM family methyltransferase
MVETITTSIPGGKAITFHCPTELSRIRAQSVLTKEPGTIAWIDSFESNTVFWDAGANVGVYSLYAAVSQNCRVVAFEPAAANYEGLNTNIRANRLDRQIQALCVCLGDVPRADYLYLQDVRTAGALHNFGEPIDYKGDTFSPTALQGAISLSIDELVERFGLAFPSYIKIDVDGAERKVISGGRATFANPRFRSVLVELDLNDNDEVSEIEGVLKAAGLRRDDGVPGNKPRPLGKALIYNLVFRR